MRQVKCINAAPASVFQVVNQLEIGKFYDVLEESDTHYKLDVKIDPEYPAYDGWFWKDRFQEVPNVG